MYKRQGVYTAQSAQTPVYIYDFVMFRVANLPSAYAADGKCLLLLHRISVDFSSLPYLDVSVQAVPYIHL